MLNEFKLDKCGFLRVDPAPSPQDLNDYYSSVYYQNPHGTYELDYSDEELLHKEIRNSFLQRVVSEGLSPGIDSLTMLDIGCGEGFLLDKFQREGWTVKGLDFSSSSPICRSTRCPLSVSP